MGRTTCGDGESAGTLTIGVLGPLEIHAGDVPVRLTSGRLRTLLAALTLFPNAPASLGQLTDIVWGAHLPDNPRHSIQTYVNRLRGVLGAHAILTRPDGYQLAVGQIDVVHFDRLLAGVASAPDADSERKLLAEALDLWRGPPFDGLRSEWLDRVEAPRLTERYLDGLERFIDLDLADRCDGALIVRLRELTARYPLRERFWGQLMLLLHRTDRPAEALDTYQQLSALLGDELGIEPSPPIRDLYRQLLAGDPEPFVPPGTDRSGATVPRQLPAAAADFTGRDDALDRLDALLPTGAEDSGPPVVAAISGGAGVGKTTLAVHWARRVEKWFPDGQLYVNLRGFDVGAAPVQPAEAVRGFLEALGVSSHRIPVDPRAQLGLYRSLLTGRRMLVLLDNARDADQVRALLPGATGCLTAVTSRNQLAGLVAVDGARPVVLDVVTDDEARHMLTRRLGPRRVAMEPGAVDEIIARSARLPLALAIVAARAATHPHFSLATLAAELRDSRARLDAFTGGDGASDLRAVFSASYDALGADAARLFRLLGLHPGPDITAPAAASLAGRPPAEVTPLLAQLRHANLVTERTPGRFSLHDLLGAYAAHLVDVHDSEDDRRTATDRMLDHYLHTLQAAADRLNPYRHDAPVLAPPEPGVTPDIARDVRHALALVDADRAILRACIDLAAATGRDRHACQLAWNIASFLARAGEWHGWVSVQGTMLKAAERQGDLGNQARAHRGLASAYLRLGRLDDAQTHLTRALNLFHTLGDGVGEGYTRMSLGWLADTQRRYGEALGQARQALDLLRAAGHPAGESQALNAIGLCHARLGRYRKAVSYCRQAIGRGRHLGDRFGEGTSWDSLAYTYHRLGDYRKAVACYERSIALRREQGDRVGTAQTLVRLGDSHREAGEEPAARRAWQRAVVIFDETNNPEGDRVRARLNQFDAAPA